jgi:Domain of unknown function (DUF4333)
MRSGFIALVAALAAAGCGQQQIDVEKASKLIKGAVAGQVGADVASISCPRQIKAEAHATFTCTVTGADGTKGVATVTQTDGKGTISVAAPFLHKDEAEQSIQSDLRKRAPRTTVVCPDIVVVKKGGTFACRADLGEFDATVRATQTDAGGNFTYALKG